MDYSDLANDYTTAWLSTTGSQIFFMQLGFLCYEVGYVESVWTQSVILKNIEDTFVGILTYLAIGFTLSESENSFYGIISIPTNPLLIGVDPHLHDQVLISAFFASTCATIISGAVLERMKNKAYIIWCLLVIVVNYSFVSHWVWHPHGWLSKLGFVDGAGAIVVHSTAGMASLIAIWRLGARKGSSNRDDSLLPTLPAARPIIHATGAFFLWFGWFAFNVSSPVTQSKGIGDAIGTTALVTVIAPIASSCGAFLWMYLGFINLSFENLLSCLLAGLVAITGPCHTCNPIESAIIGFLASILYFITVYIIRNKLHIDDPMQVISIHLICGLFSCFMEGIIANNTYNNPGLIYGGYKHFLIQLLGVTVIPLFNFIICIFLYDIILERLIFGKRDIRVSILDIYLGTRLFDQNHNMAFNEVLNCQSDAARKMLFKFHKYVSDRYASEQLDFLIVVKIFSNYLSIQNDNDNNSIKTGKYIIQIIKTYIDENAIQSINISGTQRSLLIRLKKQLLYEINRNKSGIVEVEGNNNHLEVSINNQSKSTSISKRLYIRKENVFDATFKSITDIVMPYFIEFLQSKFKREKSKFHVKIPFKLEKHWILKWDETLIEEEILMRLSDTVPAARNSDTLLSVFNRKDSINEFAQPITPLSPDALQEMKLHNQYAIVFKDEKDQNNNDNNNQQKMGIVIE